MKARHLAALAIATVTFSASAQTLKPGLWEINQKVGGGQMDERMAQMQQQMASMPPEQRKMVEEMMARQGVKMGGAGPGGGMSVKVCMTKEMVERHEVPTQRGDCKTTTQPRSGNSMKVSFACTNPASSGEGEVTYSSPESYSMKMLVNTQVQGRPEKMNMEGSGKWLGADCGDVKPMAMPKK